MNLFREAKFTTSRAAANYRLIRRCSAMVVLLLIATIVRAEDIVVALLPAPQPQASGATLSADLLILNSGTQLKEFTLPTEIKGLLLNEQRRWDVVLHASKDTHSVPIPAGQFVRATYSFSVPPDALGRLVLEIDQPVVARAVVEVGDQAVLAQDTSLTQAQPTPASRIERSFASHFAFHEPIYFIYGAKAPAAKFQFSFKYRLLGPSGSSNDSIAPSEGLYMAYTQRSLWDVSAESSPFYDTSYMPELFFEWQAPEFKKANAAEGWFHWLGLQTGLRHESNGRDGVDSRSMNIAYLRSALVFGRIDNWHLMVAPRFFTYIGSTSGNPDIAKYRGYDDLELSFGKNESTQIAVATRIGRSGDKGSIQVDLTQPVRIPWIGLATYLQLQYFDGYGESLRLYNQKSTVWRLGIAFVR